MPIGLLRARGGRLIKFSRATPGILERLASRYEALRQGRERGAQLIEFALILPILLSLLFGIVTGGLAFSQKLSLDNAARETARFAATLPVDGDLSAWLDQIADVAISTSTGSLDVGVAGREICVAYVFPDGTDVDDRTTRVTEDAAGVRTQSAQPCVVDTRPADERRVQVLVERESDLIVFYFTRSITLDSQSIARFERGDK